MNPYCGHTLYTIQIHKFAIFSSIVLKPSKLSFPHFLKVSMSTLFPIDTFLAAIAY